MIVRIEEDANGDLYFELPPEINDELDWKAGDQLIWTIHDDGYVSVEKKDNQKPDDQD